ncbi:MAG: hypothetical protein ABIH66_13765 [bacterium]
MPQMLSTALILATGAIAISQDLTTRKVRNWLLVLVLSIYGALLVAGWLTIGPWSYNAVITNIIIGAVCSIAMWHFEIWPAGDAKLFILFVILLPQDYYVNGSIMYFPSLALLLNIFCLGVAFLCLKVIVRLGIYVHSLVARGVFLKTARSGGRDALKGLPTFSNTMLLFMLTFLVARLVGDSVVGYGSSIFKSLAAFQFLFVFLFYRRLVTFFRSRLVITTCLLTLLCLVMVKFALVKFNFVALYDYMSVVIRLSLYSIMAIQVLITAFDVYINATQVFEITPDRLEPWTIIDKDSVAANLKEHSLTIKFSADGIEPGDVEKLREILPDDHKIKVHKTFPFSPFVVGGVLLTMILKMSLLQIIIMKLR